MNPRLAWTTILNDTLDHATDGDVENFWIEETVDPLRKKINIIFRDALPGSSWNPFQALVHGFAMANDCMIQSIRKASKRSYVIDVLIKKRLGPRMENNPLLLSGWTSKYERDKFLRLLRDKIGTWMGVRHERISEHVHKRSR